MELANKKIRKKGEGEGVGGWEWEWGGQVYGFVATMAGSWMSWQA